MDLPTNEALVNKPRKKKPLTKAQHTEILPSPAETRTNSSRKGQKPSKKGVAYEIPSGFASDKIDSAADAELTPGGNEYRALRRKYLLLEEESFGLGRELKVVEDDIKALEEEKLSLLDELVVLEGLVDPLNVHARKP
ncbi:auxin response factor 2 [Striga asiatica]|uniref:Auxin response factor 2 n=1 Tax=Striga asiatica TaxID=4170 RepID=A0A5A7P7R7_STRAF|nr:auxin response factor 2 [Striga asiatica]